MLTTHLASWLVSRVLKGRTLTATFTEAPAMAPVRPPSSAGEQRQRRRQRGWGDPDVASQLLPGTSLSTPPRPQLPSPSKTQSLFPWPSSPMSLSSGTPGGVPASLPSHIPAHRDLGCHPRVTWRPGPRPGELYQFWLPPALVGGAPSYTGGLAAPAGAVGETLVVGEEWLGGTNGSRGVSGLPGLEGKE